MTGLVSTPRLALVAGGGSGGHVFPGLAVADVLARRDWAVQWIGGATGMERRLVERAGLPFHAVEARPFLGRGWTARIGAVLRLLASAWALRKRIRALGAKVLLGTGGYVSAPAVLAARWAACPVLIFEPNAEEGLANRVLSRIAREAAVAHDVTASRLHCAATVTGIPVRDAFFQAEAVENLSSPPVRVLVVGGSQGARQLNETLPRALAIATRDPDASLEIRVTHQTGAADEEKVRAAYVEEGLDATVVPFLAEMPAAMAQHHLLVSRAGAITLAEICAAGRPAVLVPLPQAAGHQSGNARVLEEAGAARMVPSSECTPEALAEAIVEIASQPEVRRDMGRSARALAHREAAASICDRLEALAGRGSTGGGA